MRRLITTGRLVRDAWLMLGLAMILFCLLELSEWHAAFVEAREPVAA